MSTPAPRPPLDLRSISEKISQYWRVSVVEVTGSTQDDLSALVRAGNAHPGELIVTEFQSAGRGRLDRKFLAPKTSALLFSFYIEPKRDLSEWSFLPLLTGLAAAHALSELDPRIDVMLKWPNDLLINESKFGGVITQVIERGVVIGVGINVGMQESELPVADSTSLSIHNFQELDRNIILSRFLGVFENLFHRWESGEDLRHHYCERSSTIGRKIQVSFPDGTIKSNIAKDLGPTGELICEDGARITVGDIVHLR